MKINYKTFKSIYHKNVASIMHFWNEKKQKLIAKHNFGYEEFNFENYLNLSAKRYYICYLQIKEKKKVLDVGGLFGAFPLTLIELGYDVSMVETLKYYDNAFNDIFDFLRKKNLKIIDLDPFNERIKKKFDFISCNAILEHYPYSISFFTDNLINSLSLDGKLYIEVPNIACSSKRIDLLMGKTPLVHIERIIKSEIPFTGHHHEYTMDELIFISNYFKLKTLNKNYFSYSYEKLEIKHLFHPKQFLLKLIEMVFKNTREIISITLQP